EQNAATGQDSYILADLCFYLTIDLDTMKSVPLRQSVFVNGLDKNEGKQYYGNDPDSKRA
ncbi:MAG: hypothetical protein ACM31E_02855, partial [Fibrobacterota bacterium]|nr:hypothetical protein [Chitinispirillaceae bacterium]